MGSGKRKILIQLVCQQVFELNCVPLPANLEQWMKVLIQLVCQQVFELN